MAVISAPICKPSATADAVIKQITFLSASKMIEEDRVFSINNNRVRLKLKPYCHDRKFIGFVQNPDQDSDQLIALVDGWLTEHQVR